MIVSCRAFPSPDRKFVARSNSPRSSALYLSVDLAGGMVERWPDRGAFGRALQWLMKTDQGLIGLTPVGR